jgi:hypothetical protein
MQAAENGLGSESNPYKKNSADARDWAEGHALRPVSKTPLDHTYKVGDVVQYRSINSREQAIDKGEDTLMYIGAIIQITKEEGARPSQQLFVEGKNAPISSVLVELIEEDNDI